MSPRLLICMLVVCIGCRGRDDLDGRRRPIPGLSERGQEYALVGDDTRTVLDFASNRAAASVHADGTLVIECGTADMAKYVEGSYRSPWYLSADDGGQRAALLSGLAGELYLPIDADPGGVTRASDGSLRISLRARAAAKRQLVSVFLNEKRLGDIAMSETAWQTYSIRAPQATVLPGENKLRFYFRHAGELDGKHTAAAIQRIGVGMSDVPATAVLTSDSVIRGKKSLSALRVAHAARISFYTQVPVGRPALVFAAAGKGTDLAVRVAGGRGSATQAGAEEVWHGQGTDQWSEARVELGQWAGEVVRIDFVSNAPADWGRPQLVVPASARPAPRWTGPPADHVIVWAVSALRADRLAGTIVPTPAMARLVARGIRFTGAYAAAAQPGAAHVAMLAGVSPQGGAVPPGARTLGERFSEAGYTTALVSGNGFVNDEAGFARGFAVYRNPMRHRHPFRAHVLWQQARRVLQKNKDGRTFTYVSTVEPHLPYNPSAESLAAEWDHGPMRFEPTRTIALSEAVAAGTQQLSREEQSYVEALYNAEVRDADAAFGEMLADLDQLGITERTAVVLVADHGEELWERGGFGHGRTLYEEVLHVPLVIAPPGSSRAVVAQDDVTLVDLYATVLGLAGITAGSESQGKSMLGEPSLLPTPVFSYLSNTARGLKLGRYKLIVPLRGSTELYDLVADPGERTNLAGSRPIIERYMRTVFGIGVAYQAAWSQRRWGAANNMSPAFAADHGL